MRTPEEHTEDALDDITKARLALPATDEQALKDIITATIKEAQLAVVTECSTIASIQAGKVAMGETSYLKGYMYGAMSVAIAINQFKMRLVELFK